MFLRTGVVCALLLCFVSTSLGDILIFKDGTRKHVRIYKMTKEYISYLSEGKIQVISRGKLKAGKAGYKITGKALTDRDLAEAIKKSRAEMKKKLQEAEKKNGIAPTAVPVVKSVMDPTQGGKGVKVISKDKSKTHATELMIDPFPDHPVKGEGPKKSNKTLAKKTPAKKVYRKSAWRAKK